MKRDLLSMLLHARVKGLLTPAYLYLLTREATKTTIQKREGHEQPRRCLPSGGDGERGEFQKVLGIIGLPSGNAAAWIP